MSIKRFFFRRRWDEERARELEAHLAIETDDNIARGLPVDRARAAARRKLGNATLIREEIYEMNTIGLVDSVWQDLKYAIRGLRLNPVFALVAIVSLALGIGANTAIFQLIDAVRLRTLPVANPQDIVLVSLKDPDGARGSFESWYPALTNPLWEQIRDAELVAHRAVRLGACLVRFVSIRTVADHRRRLVGERRLLRRAWRPARGRTVVHGGG